MDCIFGVHLSLLMDFSVQYNKDGQSRESIRMVRKSKTCISYYQYLCATSVQCQSSFPVALVCIFYLLFFLLRDSSPTPRGSLVL